MKQTKHFVPKKIGYGNGKPACNCYSGKWAFKIFEEVAEIKQKVTCKNCKRTIIFRKIK